MPSFEIENQFDCPYIFGVDEVGRGPLAGPVVASCVYIPQDARTHPVWSEVRDSKKLSATKREKLFLEIKAQSVFGIGMASVEEIDSINILQASFLAMRRALESCTPAPQMVLVDGNRSPKDWAWEHKTVIKGDSKSISIAAASVLAKVTRDRIMNELGQSFPQYGWEANAGYGTATHMGALQSFGVTPHHRKTFAPVRDALLKKAG